MKLEKQMAGAEKTQKRIWKKGLGKNKNRLKKIKAPS